MNWTTPTDLRAEVQRRWDRGDLLRDAVSGSATWPMRLRLRVPTADDLSERFDAVRGWAGRLLDLPHLRIEWRERNHRVQGTQRFPVAAWIDSLKDALALIGKVREARRFEALWQSTAAAQPSLLAWLSKRPLQAIELAERWEALLAIVAWLKAHPRPGIYVRQIDVAGVDSKFVETHRGVLTELLDMALPPSAIDPVAIGTGRFARRFGFLEKPLRVRFRLLDPTTPCLHGFSGRADVTLDAASFAELDLPVERVFITENETNFLAFPAVDRAIVLFGAGYGWEALSRADRLRRCSMHYWGDLDTHGFAILDQLRAHFPRVRSFLMDRATLLAHRAHWGVEIEPARQDLPRLTPDEAMLYDDLRFDRLQPGVRLEQEHIAFGWLLDRLGEAT